MVGFKTLKYNLIYGVILLLIIVGIISRARMNWKAHEDEKMAKRIVLLILNIFIGLIILVFAGVGLTFLFDEFEKEESKK